MSLQLRSYQVQAIDATFGWLEQNPAGHPVLSLCVSAGKSYIIAGIIHRVWQMQPGTRVLMVVHTKELIAQNENALLQIWPDAPVGVFSAGLGRRELDRPIVYGSIQSLARRVHDLGQVGLVFVDEAHRINRDSASQYHALIKALREVNPDLCVIGLTGTPFHADGTWITSGPGTFFSDIAAHIGINDLLHPDEEGKRWLTPLVGAPASLLMDANGMRKVAGDYVDADLARAFDKAEIVDKACREAVRLAAGRQRWLVYAITVEHAGHVLQKLRDLGVSAKAVFGHTKNAERDEIIEAFRRGEFTALVNCMVLTVGFSVPEVDCLVLLRPTQSLVLYVQVMGRGMRLAPGKADCLVLDFTGTVAQLGPVNEINGHPHVKSDAKEPLRKHCPECGAKAQIGADCCPCCGFVFLKTEPPERKLHDITVSMAEVLGAVGPTRKRVTRITMARHRKDGRPDSLRVDLYEGFRRHASEWLALELDGFAVAMARKRWFSLGGRVPAPSNVSEALGRVDEIRTPFHIITRKQGRFTEVLRYERD